MVIPHSVLIPIGALLVILGGLVHGIWYAYRQHKRQKHDFTDYR